MKIRIHKDITVRWRVTTAGEAVPLTGRDLAVVITDPTGRKKSVGFAVTDNNLITFIFAGKDQTQLGKHTASLLENAGKDGSSALDAVDFVQLVRYTSMEDFTADNGNLEVASINLEGNLSASLRGASAYETWLVEGHTGSEADFLEWLRGPKGDKGDKGEKGDKGDKGDKGEQGPVGAPGATGDPGAPGEKGEKGDKGDKGEKGDQGIQGLTGATGATGATGPVGPQGPAGSDASVTSQNIQSALGYAPAKAADLTDLSSKIGELETGKQGTIADLEQIRSGAAKGATALQSHQPLKTINGQSIVGEGNIEIQGGGGDGMPDEVKKAIYKLFANADYQPGDFSEELGIIKAWSGTIDPDPDELPEGYTRLAALYSPNQNNFFNTGVVFDVTQGCDLYFSVFNTGTYGYAGVRRASTDNNKVAVYIKGDSSISGYAGLWASKDEGVVTASGSGSPWKANIKKASIRKGRFYAWDKLIRDYSDIAIATDGVPFHLGGLAKSATTTYYNYGAPSQWYRAKFYDADDNLSHDFLPCLSPNGVKGFYDLVAKEFKVLNGTGWTAVSLEAYMNSKLRYVISANSIADFSAKSYQSACRYGEWFLCSPIGQTKFALISSDAQSIQLLLPQEADVNWHGNNMWFSSEKYVPGDYFPILYVDTIVNGLLVAYRLIGSDPEHISGIEIVQRITYPTTLSDGTQIYLCSHNGAYGSNRICQHAYAQNSSSDGTNNSIYLREFPLPSISAGDVSYTPQDASFEHNMPYRTTSQAGTYINGRLLMTYGSSAYGHFVILDLSASGMEVLVDEDYRASGADWLYGGENEGLVFDAKTGKFTMLLDYAGGNIMDVECEQYRRVLMRES